jgi:hypothetical protein
MSRIIARLLTPIALASTVAFAACDDGDSTPAAAADTSASSDAEAPTDDAAAPADDAAAPADDATVTPEVPTNACTNSADLAVIQNAETNPSAKAAYCGQSVCIETLSTQGLEAALACAQECMLDTTIEGFSFAVSADCSTCYVNSLGCTVANECLGDCLSDANAPNCIDCRTEAGCFADFYACSGLTPPPAAE